MAGLLERRHFLDPLRSIFDDDVSDWFVGVDRMLEDMATKWDHALEAFNEYPTSRIEKTDDTHYRVLVKAPGYAKGEISVRRVDDELVITGTHEGKEQKEDRRMSFEQHFYLAPDITVEGAKFDKDQLAIDVSFPEPPAPAVQEITIA